MAPKPFSTGMYSVEEQRMRNLPETPRYAKVRWLFEIDGTTPLEYYSEIAYKFEEPSRGEIWKPFDILPPAVVEFTQSSYLFTAPSQAVTVRIKALRDSVSGTAALNFPNGWKATGDNRFFIARKGEEKTLTFEVSTTATSGEINLGAALTVDNRSYNMRLIPIEYEHIRTQNVLLPAQVKASVLSLQVAAKKVGYYMGAGDEIPDALKLMGCQVTLLEDKDLTADNLRQFDAVVLGVRAYNTKQALALRNTDLFEYVNQGGTLVTQYNNNFDYTTDKVSPLPLKLSRTRVTDETAQVRFLKPEHQVLNAPNKLTDADFQGWVQERGLYFPSEWDGSFVAPISCNDPNESPADGSLLIAPHGKGTFVYTALSFFRELPAGVPGAYRLFANIISL